MGVYFGSCMYLVLAPVSVLMVGNVLEMGVILTLKASTPTIKLTLLSEPGNYVYPHVPTAYKTLSSVVKNFLCIQ